ncbi:fungal-specific transcription factor domain-containing protein [Nemania abortiva]|nr:fungal-specific transcription factor domain-containing protein [Nemania abortiva]
MPQRVEAPGTPSRQRPGGACEECRRRKLRCDRQHPQCGVCAAAGVACFTTTTRAPRGPKRGYLKAMQARIAALEGAVNQHQADGDNAEPVCVDNGADDLFAPDVEQLGWQWDFPTIDTESFLHDASLAIAPPYGSSTGSTTTGSESAVSVPPTRAFDDVASPEALNSLAAFEDANGFCTTNISTLMQAELDQLYFDRVDSCMPIIHQGRYSSWARQTTKTRQQLCLQYTLWTAAAAASAHYQGMGELLYCEARRLVRDPEEGLASPTTTEIEHVQALLLLAIHELMFIDFRRGWISAGRAFRLIQLDWARYTNDLGSECAPAQWIEMEQKRRTFWMAYCLDRFMSLRSGSPPTFSEQNIIRLPAPEAAFQNDGYVLSGCLADAIASKDANQTSPFTECIVVATMAGRALSHQHLAATQPNPPRDFWDRHQLINSVMMPRMAAFSLKYPPTMQEADPVLLFVSLMWRATVLFSQVPIVAETAVSAADDSGFVVAEYARRSSLAGQEVVSIAKKLAQVNWFKVGRANDFNFALTAKSPQIHPLMPIPLSLCSELLNSQSGLDESVEKRLPFVQEVMNDIKRFNNLGRGFYNYKA